MTKNVALIISLFIIYNWFSHFIYHITFTLDLNYFFFNSLILEILITILSLTLLINTRFRIINIHIVSA